jgi:hypothetical protein
VSSRRPARSLDRLPVGAVVASIARPYLALP